MRRSYSNTKRGDFWNTKPEIQLQSALSLLYYCD